MNLGLNDLHLILDGQARLLSLWNANHGRVFECETRNKTTADGQYGHDGNCPPGAYLAGIPVAKGTVPFGAWFVPVLDYGDHHTMAQNGRAGIGIHGGGSGLGAPFSPRQGWQVTHGCWRVQNEDLAKLVHLLNLARDEGGQVFVTVQAGAPGAEAPDPFEGDWAPLVPLGEGE